MRPVVLFVVAVVLVGAPGIMAFRNYLKINEMNKQKREASNEPYQRQNRAELLFPPDWQERVAVVARESDLKRLSQMNLIRTSLQSEIHIHWEGSFRSTVRFLAGLESGQWGGQWNRLQLSGASSEPGYLSGKGVFVLSENSQVKKISLQKSDIIVRNVFEVPHRNTRREPSPLFPKPIENENARQTETDKQKREAEQARLDEKTRHMASQYFLTGIVNNGQEPLAFLSMRNSGQPTRVIRMGDVVEEARVASINEARGEVLMDYEGKVQVTLHLTTPGLP